MKQDQISDLEDKVDKNTQSSEKKIFFLNEESLRNILENMKGNNICIMEIPEGEESKQWIKSLFEEIMTKNILNLVKGKYSSPGSSESPKQVEPKGAYTKTHHNYNGKP